MILIKFLLSIFLIIGIIFPKFAWMMSEGWKLKNAEPSDLYLVMCRISSVIILIAIWIAIPN